ncbi:hypothetical protein DER45DRAFT_619878 [Fusarium avenaceum]|nr:hypothetical protein DER45DRAFT_619878 [Fusarium avenaceum]
MNVRSVRSASACLSRLAFGPTTRRCYSTQSLLREYFVLVWDKPGADRSRVGQCDLRPPFYAFAGECLEQVSPEQEPKAIGNAFACYASDLDQVKAKMASSIYSREGVWNLDTASISPLMTVHSKAVENKA